MRRQALPWCWPLASALLLGLGCNCVPPPPQSLDSGVGDGGPDDAGSFDAGERDGGVADAGGWTFEPITVGFPLSGGGGSFINNSLVVTSAGQPIVLNDDYGPLNRHSWEVLSRVDGGWQVESPAIPSGLMWICPVMALDPAQDARVLCAETPLNRLYERSLKGGEVSALGVPVQFSGGLDEWRLSRRSAAVHGSVSTDALGVAWFFGEADGGMRIETVFGDGGVRFDRPLDFSGDTLGVPHYLASAPDGGAGLFYLTREDGGWVAETVSATARPTEVSLIAVDPDIAVAAFSDPSQPGVFVAVRSDGGWSIEQVSPAGSGLALLRAPVGTLHLFVRQGPFGQHFFRLDGSWKQEVVPSPIGWCGPRCIAIDDLGNLHTIVGKTYGFRPAP